MNLATPKGRGFQLHAAWATVVALTRGPQRFCVFGIPLATRLLDTFVSQVVGGVLIAAVFGVALRAHPFSIGETEVSVLVVAWGSGAVISD